MKPYIINIRNHKTFEADPRLSFFENLRRNGIEIESACGGVGICGKCRVRFLVGVPAASVEDERHISEQDIADGWRLACTAMVETDVTIVLPGNSFENNGESTDFILTKGVRASYNLNPKVKKHYIELETQTIEKPTGDAELIRKALADEKITSVNWCTLEYLPKLLRESDYKVTATLYGDRVIKVQKGDKSGRNYGIAFDIGTTTIVGALIDLNTGEELAVEPSFNPQRKYGYDVISRIQYCRSNQDGVSQLKSAIQTEIIEITEKLCEKASVGLDEINEIISVGNPTMAHLFLGLDPSYIGEIPYAPATEDPVVLGPDCRAFPLNVPVEVPINLSGFIGSDIVSGILSLDLMRRKDICLFIDIGTNAEIVLSGNGRLLLTNAAAGPAFEGARIECGTRALPGAIDRFSIGDGDIDYGTVKDEKPSGICGSGLVDILASLLKAEIIDPSGRLLPAEDVPSSVPQKIRDRIKKRNGKIIFDISGDVYITERDVRDVQNAKAAVAAGIHILEKRMGINHSSVNNIFIAGGFGNYVNPESAVAIGLIPPIDIQRIISVGNSALEGAKMYLLSTPVREDSKKLRKNMELYELSAAPEFMDVYTDQMLFTPPSD